MLIYQTLGTECLKMIPIVYGFLSCKFDQTRFYWFIRATQTFHASNKYQMSNMTLMSTSYICLCKINSICLKNAFSGATFTSRKQTYIMLTPLKRHFYKVKLGFTGDALFFLFLLKNIDCGYSLKPPRRRGSNE